LDTQECAKELSDLSKRLEMHVTDVMAANSQLVRQNNWSDVFGRAKKNQVTNEISLLQ
jgi:hypothetical protein